MSDIISRIVEQDIQQKIDLSNLEAQRMLEFYRQMVLIRKVEDEVAALVKAQKVRCPAHLGAGQEAVAVGVCDSLSSQDHVFGTHRSHAHYLAWRPSAGSGVERSVFMDKEYFGGRSSGFYRFFLFEFGEQT